MSFLTVNIKRTLENSELKLPLQLEYEISGKQFSYSNCKASLNTNNSLHYKSVQRTAFVPDCLIFMSRGKMHNQDVFSPKCI